MSTSSNLISRTLYDVPGYERFAAVLIPHFTTDQGSDTASFHQSVLETIATLPSEVLLLGPEWSYFPKPFPGKLLTEKEKDNFLRDIREATKGKRDLIVAPGTFVWQREKKLYNTCFVINNGEIVFAYDKRNNGGDVAIAQRHGLEWQPGILPGEFSLNGLLIGIETCIDEDYLLYQEQKNDFILLPSCGGHPFKPFQPSLAGLRSGGYKLINDGELRTAGLVQKPVSYSLDQNSARFYFPRDISLRLNLDRLAAQSIVCDSIELFKHDLLVAKILDKEKTQDLFSRQSSAHFPEDDFQFYLESVYAYCPTLREELTSRPTKTTADAANLLTFLQANGSLYRVLNSFQE